MKKKVYFENLDGLRFLCFLSVFFFHSFYTESPAIYQHDVYRFFKFFLWRNGNLGVNFFFVLSGFLITWLLIDEKQSTGKIAIPAFWMRRILRIWPLFYLCVFIGFYLFPFLKGLLGQQSHETASLGSYLLFLNNFDVIRNGMPDSSILGVLWSVAIEEQFYLFWPVILSLFPIGRMWIAFVAVIIVSLIYRQGQTDNFSLQFHTLSCIGDMGVGALGAWLVIVFPTIREKTEQVNRFVIAGVYLLFFIFFLYRETIVSTPGFPVSAERLLFSLLILFIILEQNYATRSFFKMSSFTLLSRLGQMTYGMYCLHFIGILITIQLLKQFGWQNQLWHVLVLETSLSLALTLFISWLSYRFFEKPFLQLKQRFD